MWQELEDGPKQWAEEHRKLPEEAVMMSKGLRKVRTKMEDTEGYQKPSEVKFVRTKLLKAQAYRIDYLIKEE